MKTRKMLAVLLALTLVLSLGACGKDKGPDVTGKYTCIAVANDGKTFLSPDGEDVYVTLKKGGKGEVSDGLAFDLTWKLDGETFTGTYKVFGFDAAVSGTLKDGLLELEDDGVVRRYLKEGLDLPDWAKDLEAEPSAESRLAGRYTLYAMNIGSAIYDYAALVEMGEMDDSYLQIDYDAAKGYTGELCFDGEEPDTFTLDEWTGEIMFSDGSQTTYYESEDGVLGVNFAEMDAIIFFALPGVERPDVTPPETTTEPSRPETDGLLDWWNGDWYGWWFMYGCKGAYEELEGAYWDCEAHVDIGSDYTGTMELWDDDMVRAAGGIGLAEVSLSDSGVGEYGTLFSEGGWFLESELAHADWIIDPALSGFENMLIITGEYDAGDGNSYFYKLMLRPWGQLWEDVDPDSRPWSYENWYKPMIEDGVTQMSERFGEPDPSVYEGLNGQ